MARGETTMNEIMQVVYQWHWEAGFKAISRSLGFALRLAIQAEYQNRKLPHYNYPIDLSLACLRNFELPAHQRLIPMRIVVESKRMALQTRD